MTIEMLQGSTALGGAFDSTTIYRTLMLFVEAEIVRQFRLRHKLSFFALNTPGTRFEFLICRRCGKIQELPDVPSISNYEASICTQTGYRMLYHALELYGLCPQCQAALGTSPKANKLPVSPRSWKLEARHRLPD
ncbi:MAG: Fur family transcriptional regulator [Verrucomicrobiales bacterium]|nr:Fur family transcriptional regulator [Verrucomicrobiales bacterium]